MFLTVEQVQPLCVELEKYGYVDIQKNPDKVSRSYKVTCIRELYYIIEIRYKNVADIRKSCITKKDDNIERIMLWLEERKYSQFDERK